MRRGGCSGWLSVALAASFGISLAVTAKNVAAAAQRHFNQVNPDLDTDDQLAPSQMKGPVPAAVSQPPGSAAHAAAPAVMRHAAPGPALAGHTVACSGSFAKDSSHLKLAMTFDSMASVLFPKDAKRRLEVWWANPAARSDTYLIVINGKSDWVAPGGLRLGLNLAQLEKLNHKAFKIKGFDKDGSATVSDWDGGALASLPGGCKSGVSLRADPKAASDALAALDAEKEYSSADAEIRAVKPAVSEILIGY